MGSSSSKQSKIVELEEEIKELKRREKEREEQYDSIIKQAADVLEKISTNEGKEKVAVILGSQGCGKSTACKFIFGVDGAVTGEGNTHVTKELKLLKCSKLQYPIVDGIGKTPDVRGIMRVLACVYNKGWDPVAIVVVHSGRTGALNAAASFLQSSVINVLRFEPMSFWKMKMRGGGIEMALDVSTEEEGKEGDLPKVNIINRRNVSLKTCSLTETLRDALADHSWEASQQATEYAGIAMSLTYHMARCIVDRAKFNGTDLEFIDREG